jgi:hypothetical protein
MTAKEKAIELVDNFRLNVLDYEGCGINEHKAKQCALIAVDEILKCNLETSVSSNPHIEFNSKLINQYQWWKEVKNEIKKLQLTI